MKGHSVSVDQAIYATSIVAKQLYNSTLNMSKKFYNITLPHDMIFTKAGASTSNEKVENLTR